MKKLEFETNGQKWIVVDEKDYKVFHLMLTMNGINAISLKDIAEEQASNIVKITWEHNEKQYNRYYDYINKDASYYGSFSTAIESLHSLIKSKGWHLFENPFKGEHPNDEYVAEDYTLYNPYLFKIKN